MFALMLIGIAVSIQLASCSSAEMPDEGQLNDQELVLGDDAVIKAANGYMDMIFANTRSKIRRVKNVECMTRSTTRSASDTILAVVNYENDEGFVLMAKRDDGYELFGINDENSLNLADTLFNDELAYYVRGIAKAGGFGISTDSMPAVKPDVYIEPTVTRCGPYLNENIALWNQTYPFNIGCQTEYNDSTGMNERCPAGCGPVAVGMLMAHHQWPTRYQDQTLNWANICSSPFKWTTTGYAYEDIARFLLLLGNRDNLRTEYHLEGSKTPLNRVKVTLQNFGYNVAGNWATENPIVSSPHQSDKNVPILVYGKTADDESAHLWLEDGYLRIEYSDSDPNVAGANVSYFFHFIWGWGGSGNGYYKYGQSSGHNDKGAPVYVGRAYVDLKFLWCVSPVK